MSMATRIGVAVGIIAAAAMGFALGWVVTAGDHDAAKGNADRDEARADGKKTAVDDDEHAGSAPVGRVRVAAIVQGALPIPISVTGSIIVAPAGIHLLSAPGECRVRHLLVVSGQVVAAGTPVLEIDASPEVSAQRAEAVALGAAARRDLEHVKARVALRLATVQELGQAQTALDIAELKSTAWQQRLPADGRLLTDGAGQIGRIVVQEGQVVAAGGTLAELIVPGHLEARLGIDPADSGRVVVGQRVLVTPVRRSATSAPPLILAVATLASQLTPETRLLDALVPIPENAGVVAGEYVRGELPLNAADGLIVPRAALVQDDDAWVVFIVHEHKAVRRVVTISAENRERATIAGDGLAVGDQAVIQGLTGLADGMVVEVLAESAP